MPCYDRLEFWRHTGTPHTACRHATNQRLAVLYPFALKEVVELGAGPHQRAACGRDQLTRMMFALAACYPLMKHIGPDSAQILQTPLSAQIRGTVALPEKPGVILLTSLVKTCLPP